MLIEKFNKDDYENLKQLAVTMDNDKLEVFDGMNSELIERMLNMFENVATKDQHLII